MYKLFFSFDRSERVCKVEIICAVLLALVLQLFFFVAFFSAPTVQLMWSSAEYLDVTDMTFGIFPAAFNTLRPAEFFLYMGKSRIKIGVKLYYGHDYSMYSVPHTKHITNCKC